MQIQYVVGFIFDETIQNIWLIRKNRPEWQKGLLNGIGGKVEPTDENTTKAMEREAFEETGYIGEWIHYGSMGNKEWNCEIFYSIKTKDHVDPKTQEDEKLEKFSVIDVISYKEKTISNLPWLISAALNRIYPGTEKKFSLNINYID